MRNLSVIIPAYNEGKAINQTIEFFDNFVKGDLNTEVIFVDDGSTDNTSEFFKSIKNEKIKVITHSKNKGYGAAIKTGIKNSYYEYIAITDADATYPNERIFELFENLFKENADMVVGARAGKGIEAGIFRKFGRYILKNFAEYLSNEKILDLNSGLRIVKKDVVLKFLRFLPESFSFTTTLTLSLLANGCKVAYLPINYYKRKGKSKIKPCRDTLNFLQLIIRTVMFFNPLKVFLPLSIFFIVLSLTVLLITHFLGKVMDITTILLFTTGLNLLAIGLLADLIDKRISR